MKTSYIFFVVMFLQFVWVHTLITKRSGDIKKKRNARYNFFLKFSIYLRNLNSLSAHNYLISFKNVLTLK